ncbi:MAG: thiolase family protein [Acidimicrobiales bacterium]
MTRRTGAEPGEQSAFIAGIGQSQIGRSLGRNGLDLTVEACLLAIADAGLTRDDIDGLATFPGGTFDPRLSPSTGPGTPDVQDTLRLKLNWHSGGHEGPAQLQAIANACMAVACGFARHVLVYRTTTEGTARALARAATSRATADGSDPDHLQRVGGVLQWTSPFGSTSIVNWIAMHAQRHMHCYGVTRTQLAQIAINARKNAMRNPVAIYRTALTLDDYLSSRMISSPLCLFDCDAPVDGSTAFVVSHRDHASEGRATPVFVAALGTALRGRPSWDQFEDMTTMAARDAAASMWARTELRPEDVDVAQLYDGFSWLTLCWLEELGFCGKGESGAFVEDGQRISLSGELPLNTGGGQLSGARLHGFGLLHEAVVQLRHEAGDRQVSDAEVAVVANGAGPVAGCALLTRNPV